MMWVERPEKGGVVLGCGDRLPSDVDLLRQGFEQLQLATLILGADARVRMSNPAAERLLGRDQASLVGLEPGALFAPPGPGGPAGPSAAGPLLDAVLGGRSLREDEDVFTRADGSLVPVSWQVDPIVGDGGAPVGAVLVFSDTTLRAGEEVGRAAALAVAVDERNATRAENDRVRFLARITEALGSTLDPEEALQRLSRLLVPRFGDWCVIDLLDGADVRRSAVAHRQPDLLASVEDIARKSFLLPSGPDPASLARVLQGGDPQVVTHFAPSGSSTSELERNQLELFARLGATSAIVVGLQARHRVVGAITLARSDESWQPTPADVIMADDIARRAAMALDNIRLYDEQRSTAEALQRTLLPELPTADGVALCATYVPAARSAEVGGDWYDALLLGPGRTLLVIGDVVGHDLQAAVRMSAIRTLLRAATLRTEEPADILEELDVAMARFVPDTTATVVVARLDRRGSGPAELHWSSAGHPPPLLVEPGAATFLEAAPELLLGADPGTRRTTQHHTVEPGSTVVFYTDGLVERRDRGVAEGMVRLCSVAGEGHEPGRLCDGLVTALDDGWDDDVALLAATVTG